MPKLIEILKVGSGIGHSLYKGLEKDARLLHHGFFVGGRQVKGDYGGYLEKLVSTELVKRLNFKREIHPQVG